MTMLHEPGVVLPLVQRADRGLEGDGAEAGEAATPMHGSFARGMSIAVRTGAPSLPVHGACSPGSGTTSTGAPIAPGKSILPQTLVSSPLAKVSSQHFMSEGSTSLPMESSKRTYIHMVKPKRSKSTVSPLPVSVHHMADGATKNNMKPVTVNTPVSKAFSTEEVIAFGGIKSQEVTGVRSSGRLRAQPNADATQLEKAMMLAQRRNESFAQGYSSSCALDTVMGFPTTGGSAQGYGYWMQQAAVGYSGFLLPGYWMATQ
ncbi:uncharacterized protein [Lolium perenne]|uniref:uncharacterized protein n=1 Tax=Lolium perenne TaxID=4522 RepID=UPI0021F6053F|nr:uncharacterized protein LOC127327756 [Lolium perenne]